MKKNKISYEYRGMQCTSLFGYSFEEICKFGKRELLRFEIQVPEVMNEITNIDWCSLYFECED